MPVRYLIKVSPALPSRSNKLAVSGLFSFISLAAALTATFCASVDSGLENILSSSSGGRFLKSSSSLEYSDLSKR